MPMEKKVLTDAEKELKKKEHEFNKKINQVWKLKLMEFLKMLVKLQNAIQKLKLKNQ